MYMYIVLRNTCFLVQIYTISCRMTLQSLGVHLQIISMVYLEYSCEVSQNITCLKYPLCPLKSRSFPS